MATKTKEPKTIGDALAYSDGEGHYKTRDVGMLFSLGELTAYCREHFKELTPILVDQDIFSEPDVRRGDWLMWLSDKQELEHQGRCGKTTVGGRTTAKTLKVPKILYDWTNIAVSAAGAHPHSVGYRGDLPNNPMSLTEFAEHLGDGLPNRGCRLVFIEITSKLLKCPDGCLQEGDRFVWDTQTRELFRCQRIP